MGGFEPLKLPIVYAPGNYYKFVLFFICTNLEEENYGRNADIITKHFIAEGVVCDHSILVADIEKQPETIVSFYLSHLIYL